MLLTLWERAIAVLLPARCVGCGTGGAYLCEGCLGSARRLSPLTMEAGVFAFDTAAAPFAYADLPRKAVHRLKYSGLRAIAPAMAAPMAGEAMVRGYACDMVVPVPLHPKRLRERGYNQAALLAWEVARRLGTLCREDALVRTSYEQPQVQTMGREARMANVENAFAARDGALLAGMNVLLVDDVMTTGSTLDSAARALKDAGARRVHALAFAREP